MKWLPLIWAALRRKRTRTILTLSAITVAFLIFGMMSGLNASFAKFLDNIPANRITVTPRFGGRLPLAYIDQIARLDGVTHITPDNVIFGYYQDTKNRINVSMADERIVDVA